MTYPPATQNDPAAAHSSARGIVRRLARASLLLAPALLLAACGSSNDSSIRMLNVSQNYTALNIYDGSAQATPSLADVTTGTLSSYSGVASGSDTLYFTEDSNTQTDPLSSETETFTNGEHRTYVGYGDSGEFGEYEINEDEAAAGGGDAKVEVLNTADDAGAVDVYLTSSASLSGASPNFSDLAPGSASAFTSVASGTYELTVTGTGNSSDLRLQLPNVTLDSGEVVSVIVTESSGGYLVNADILPQQGSLTTDFNPDARVRAVVGLSSGSGISVSVGSVSLLSNASDTDIGTYQLVPTGTQTVSVSVNGVAASSPEETLAAGQDYTLLVYQSSGGIEENWLIDTNDLPASGEASVRLVDAISGLTDPISLAVNSVPVATDVSLGSASSYDAGVDATTEAAVTITDVTTSQPLYSQSSITFNSQGVYTLFMFGSASSPNAILNEDR